MGTLARVRLRRLGIFAPERRAFAAKTGGTVPRRHPMLRPPSVFEAVEDTIEWSRERFAVEQDALLETVKSEAANVVEVSEEQNSELRERMQPLYDQFVTKNGEPAAKLMQRWKEALGED